MTPVEEASRPDTHLRDYAAVAWKRKWLVLIAILAILLPVLVYVNWIQSAEYESTAALMVKLPDQRADIFEKKGAKEKPDVATEVEVMKSPPVTARAASIMEAAGLDPVRWLRKADWNRIEETAVVHITALAPTPELARDLANSLGDNYVAYCRSSRQDDSRTVLAWLERQVAEAKTRMQRDEQALQEFSREHPQAMLSEETGFDREYYGTLMKESADAELAKAAAGAQLENYGKMLDKAEIPRTPDGTQKVAAFDLSANAEDVSLLAATSNSPRLASIVSDLDSARAALKEKQKRLKNHHPEIIALNAQIATLNNYCDAAFLTETQKGYSERKARLSGLESLVLQRKRDIDDFKKHLLQISGEKQAYSLLQRNIEAARMLYSILMEKLKQSDLSRGAAEEGAKFVQRATLGILKDPHNGVKVAFALLCGLLLGIGAAVLMEHLDTTLKTAEEIEHALGLAVIGTVPALQPTPAAAGEEDEPELVVALD